MTDSRAGREHDEVFMQFVRERTPSLRRAAFLLCGSWADGDDLLQEALTKVYVAWPRIEAPHVAAYSYTRTTMLRSYLNGKRKFGREFVVDELPEAPTTPHDETLPVVLTGLLKELPDRQRAVVVLRFYQDLSVPQIAAELGIPEGTVKSQLSRALGVLRTRLGDGPGDDPGDTPRDAATGVTS